MYVRTPRASAWLDADDTVDALHQGNAAKAGGKPRPKSVTLEARKAFQGKLGRYIALKYIPSARPGVQGVILVAVANKSPTERGPWWVKVENALDEREAAQWARDGF
jgi:hypothetical protein